MYNIEILLDPNHPTQQCDPQDIGGRGKVVGVSDARGSCSGG
ncbi:MAG TPA: hypothetical protein VF331_16575 [Polyangiales bacterium]|jgi:hypothetical protein